MNEVELLRQEVLNIIEQMSAALAQSDLAQTAQKAAWLLLLRHLSIQGYVSLETAQKDLEALAQTPSNEDLQSAYAEFANAVRLLRGAPEAPPQWLLPLPG